MNEVMVKNAMEMVVFDAVERYFAERGDLCSCPKCKADVAAIVLNAIKPNYVASEKGRVISKTRTMENQASVDVLTNIVAAAEIVSRQPRHETAE